VNDSHIEEIEELVADADYSERDKRILLYKLFKTDQKWDYALLELDDDKDYKMLRERILRSLTYRRKHYDAD